MAGFPGKTAPKVNSRLAGPLVELYTKDYNPCAVAPENSPGMKVLEQLRHAVGQLELLGPVVVSLSAKPGGPDFSGEALLEAVRKATEGGLKVAPLFEVAFSRNLAVAQLDQNFKAFFAALEPCGGSDRADDGAETDAVKTPARGDQTENTEAQQEKQETMETWKRRRQRRPQEK